MLELPFAWTGDLSVLVVTFRQWFYYIINTPFFTYILDCLYVYRLAFQVRRYGQMYGNLVDTKSHIVCIRADCYRHKATDLGMFI